MISLDNILDTLRLIEKKYNYIIKLGIAGSYARGEETKESDLDIVIDGDSMRQDIAEYIKKQFQIEVDTLWLDLLKKEDEDLDAYATSCGFTINEESVYKTIMKEVIWS